MIDIAFINKYYYLFLYYFTNISLNNIIDLIKLLCIFLFINLNKNVNQYVK